MGTMWQSTRERVGGCQVFLRICVCIYVSAYLLSHLFCSCLCDLCQQAVEMFPWNEECVKESVVAYTYEHMEALESRHTVCH